MASKRKLYTAAQIVEKEKDISLRQLDYWIRKGYIQPDVIAKGSGSVRYFTKDTWKRIKTFGTLMNLGIRPNLCNKIIEVRQILIGDIFIQIQDDEYMRRKKRSKT